MAAVTFVDIATPNAAQTSGDLLGYKARMITVTGNASYATGGDTLTAAALGWNSVFAFIPFGPAAPTGGATAKPVFALPNTAQSQLAFQFLNENDAGAYAQRVALAEVQATNNNSTFKVTGIVLGT